MATYASQDEAWKQRIAKELLTRLKYSYIYS